MSRAIMQQALATLKNCLPVNYCYNNFGDASPMYKKDGLSVEKINESINALEAELAKPEQAKYSDIVSDGGLDPRNKFDAQPEQEPVAQIRIKNGYWIDTPRSAKVKSLPDGLHDLYTAPPRKEWLTLSDTEINKIVDLNTSDDGGFDIFCDGFAVARIVCAKLKELNK